MSFRDRDKDWIRNLSDVIDTCLEHMHGDKQVTNFRHYVTDRVDENIVADKVFDEKETEQGFTIHSVNKKFRPPGINSIYTVDGSRAYHTRIDDDEISVRFKHAFDERGLHAYLSHHHDLSYQGPQASETTYHDGRHDILRVRREKGGDHRQIIIPEQQTRRKEISDPLQTILNDIYQGEAQIPVGAARSRKEHVKPGIGVQTTVSLLQEQNQETIPDLQAKIMYMQTKDNIHQYKREDRQRGRKAIYQGDDEDTSNEVIAQTAGIFDFSPRQSYQET